MKWLSFLRQLLCWHRWEGHIEVTKRGRVFDGRQCFKCGKSKTPQPKEMQ